MPSEMWAQVKFHSDEEVILRPLSFFKDSEKVVLELQKNQVRDEYLVFWSPKVDDTPEKLMKKQGRVLIIDTLKGSELKFLKAQPQAGWYKATIINYEDSFEALNQLLDGTVVEGKRKRKLPVPPVAVEPKQKKYSRQVRETKELARKRLTMPIKPSDESNENNLSEGSTEDEETTTLFTNKQFLQLRKENKEMKNELKSLKMENSLLSNQVKTLLELNCMWQKKYLENPSSSKKSIKLSKKSSSNNSADDKVMRSLHGSKISSVPEEASVRLPQSTVSSNISASNELGAPHLGKENTVIDFIEPTKADNEKSSVLLTVEPAVDLFSIEGDIPIIFDHSPSARRSLDFEEPSPLFDSAETGRLECVSPHTSNDSSQSSHVVIDTPAQSSVQSFSNDSSPHQYVKNVPNHPSSLISSNDSSQCSRPVKSISTQSSVQFSSTSKKNKNLSLAGLQMTEEEFLKLAPEANPKVVEISFSSFLNFARHVKEGKDGDSLFFKHIFGYQYSSDYTALLRKSVSGKGGVNPNHKSVSEEPITPEKLHYARDFLRLRILAEPCSSTLSDAEKKKVIEQRLNKYLLNVYAREKIKTLRRSLKSSKGSSEDS